ncbi:MAG: ATP-binding cassette domain-containing protein [Gammaproteobacteria bacterium]|nr:ATP-binding cassette domain-containing protein [Gammaproteobacteria bacterium]
MTGPVVSAKNLTRSFGSGHTVVMAVDNVTLDIMPAEIVLIMGPSGSGKTTLLSMLGGLLRPSQGTIEISGTNITALKESALPEIRALKIGFIFQTFNLLDALTVEENILFPAQLHPGDKHQAKRRASKLIKQLGLENRRTALPQTLSGGEKQRVAIARALINEPKLILADEPTGNLDTQTGQEVMMILQTLAREHGYSVIIVTHDPRVEDIADRILWLEDGKLTDRKEENHKWVKDPVCGMHIDEWTAKIKIDYNNTTFSFCSNTCLKRFDDNPAKYTKAMSTNP